MFQTERKKEKKNMSRAWDLRATLKYTNIHIMGISGEETEKETERIFEEIIKIFLKWWKMLIYTSIKFN